MFSAPISPVEALFLRTVRLRGKKKLRISRHKPGDRWIYLQMTGLYAHFYRPSTGERHPMTIHTTPITPIRGGYSRAVVRRNPDEAGDFLPWRAVTRATGGHLVLFNGRVMVPGRLLAVPGGLS